MPEPQDTPSPNVATKEILKKVKRINLRTSHRVDELLTGGWHSAFKGRGIEFEEVRPYQIGDDVRAIDWNVTARSDAPYIKLFREERELSVVLLIDISASMLFGTQSQSKRELVIDLAATLAMSAIRNNDKVGMTLFSDHVEQFLPPRKGSRHVLRIIRELLTHQSIGRQTDHRAAIDHLSHSTRKRSVVFWISDFLFTGPVALDVAERSMKVAARAHDVIPVVVSDPRERDLPNVGLLPVTDWETGETTVIDTGSRRVRRAIAEKYDVGCKDRDDLFGKLNWSPLELQTGQDLAQPLKRYFHYRERRH